MIAPNARACHTLTNFWLTCWVPIGKSVTLAAQAMQAAGLIGYRWGTIQIEDRPGLEKAACECYATVQERFDAFLKPPSTAVQGNTQGRIRPRGWVAAS